MEKIFTFMAVAASAFGKWLIPFLKKFLKTMRPVLMDAANEAVRAVAASYQATGDARLDAVARREAAFDLIEDNLRRQGIEAAVEFGLGAIYDAIQIACKDDQAG